MSCFPSSFLRASASAFASSAALRAFSRARSFSSRSGSFPQSGWAFFLGGERGGDGERTWALEEEGLDFSGESLYEVDLLLEFVEVENEDDEEVEDEVEDDEEEEELSLSVSLRKPSAMTPLIQPSKNAPKRQTVSTNLVKPPK